MFLHKLYINIAIAHILVYRKSLYDLQEPSYDFRTFQHQREAKNRFLRFSRKISILDPMLLHNTNINVAIAHILVSRKRLYELPKRIWNFHDFAKRAWPKNPTWQGPSVLRFFLVFIGTNTNHIHQKLACSKPFPGIFIK